MIYQNRNDYSLNWYSSNRRIPFFIYSSIENSHNYSCYFLISISLRFSLISVIFRAFPQIFYIRNYIFYLSVFMCELLIIWNLLLIILFSFVTLISSNHSFWSAIDFHQCSALIAQNFPIYYSFHWRYHQYDINYQVQNPFILLGTNIFQPGLPALELMISFYESFSLMRFCHWCLYFLISLYSVCSIILIRNLDNSISVSQYLTLHLIFEDSFEICIWT